MSPNVDYDKIIGAGNLALTYPAVCFYITDWCYVIFYYIVFYYSVFYYIAFYYTVFYYIIFLLYRAIILLVILLENSLLYKWYIVIGFTFSVTNRLYLYSIPPLVNIYLAQVFYIFSYGLPRQPYPPLN
jgi:hypothetical protein